MYVQLTCKKFQFGTSMINNAPLKDSRLNIRCDTYSRQLLDKAAAYNHVSVSKFVLSQALASAQQIVQNHEAITLDVTDFQAFLSALDTPTEMNPALKRAFARHADQVIR